MKSTAIFRYSESMVSFRIQAQAEKKDLEESNFLLQDKKAALERAKEELASEVEDLQSQIKSKDSQ